MPLPRRHPRSLALIPRTEHLLLVGAPSINIADLPTSPNPGRRLIRRYGDRIDLLDMKDGINVA